MTAQTTRADVLPRSLPPRGLSRVEAAAYIGVDNGPGQRTGKNESCRTRKGASPGPGDQKT